MRVNPAKSTTSAITRRDALKSAAGIGALGALGAPFPTPALLKGSPNERIRIGVIGVGRRGSDHLRALGYPRLDAASDGTVIPDTEVVAVCDAFEDNLDRAVTQVAHTGAKPGRYVDHREMLEKEHLDAVVIATPDHLHVPLSIDAARAGCDVYVEKCLSNDVPQAIELGRVLQEEKRILQLGLQLHQDRIHRLAAEVVQAGTLGDVHMVQLFISRNGPQGAWVAPQASKAALQRERLHWELFLGHAPKRDFDPLRFLQWRHYWDYSTGISGDIFSATLGTAQAILNLGMPSSAVASGGIYHWKDARETPDHFHTILEYPDRNLSVTFLCALANQYPNHMTRVFGDDATMEVSFDLKVYPDRFSKRYRAELDSGKLKATEPFMTVSAEGAELTTEAAPSELWLEGRGMTKTVRDGRVVGTTRLHHEEFIDCIRERREPSCGYETALKSTIGCHMATAAYRHGTRVGWDAARQQISGLPAAAAGETR